MKKKLATIFGVILILTLISSVYAWWFIFYIPVTSCVDTDGGLDFRTQGTISITGNITGNFTDYCINNYTVAEYACSQDMGYPPGVAGLIGESCQNVTNATMCYQGRCI